MADTAAKAASKTRSVNIPAELHARLASHAEDRLVGINFLVTKACERLLRDLSGGVVGAPVGAPTVDPGT